MKSPLPLWERAAARTRATPPWWVRAATRMRAAPPWWVRGDDPPLPPLRASGQRAETCQVNVFAGRRAHSRPGRLGHAGEPAKGARARARIPEPEVRAGAVGARQSCRV